MLNLQEHPHCRLNPLTGEWVLVSPHRTKRPWQGQVEKTANEVQAQYDPACYLCPGNERAGGIRNPSYSSTFVFDNDFAALMPEVPNDELRHGELIVARGEPGICRVICFSPRHDLTLARMTLDETRAVVDVWAEQYLELRSRGWISYVQIFENRGAMMGASNPHPHCQVWATADLPNEPVVETRRLDQYHATHARCLLCDYVQLEISAGERVVLENKSFVAVVPFWAVWPFETLVISKRHVRDIADLDDLERNDLADVLNRLTATYDGVFGTPFPYTMGFHQQPCNTAANPVWHLHAHFYPPLLRSATVRKFMVGYEMLGMPQRDITPESAAERLRELAQNIQLARTHEKRQQQT
jgi:UDPglucose--hexose-1-phosphate uridylyltransferase